MKKIAAAVLLTASLATPAFAEGYFIGADIGTAAGYPDRTGETINGLIGAGATYASATQKTSSVAFDLHGGQWITERFGWEVGYDAFGSVDGSWTSIGSTTGSYKYSASAVHVAALGGIPLGRGKLYGKAGLFSASTKEDASNTVGFSSSKTQSSTGLLIGGGYELSFSDKIAGHAGMNLFNGMKFNDFTNNTTSNKTLVQVLVGVDYKF